MKVLRLSLIPFVLAIAVYTTASAQIIHPPNVGIGTFTGTTTYPTPIVPLHIQTGLPWIKLNPSVPGEFNTAPEGDIGIRANLSTFETPGDFVIRSGSCSEDLILTTINGGAVRLGTSQQNVHVSCEQSMPDIERVTITNQGLVGINVPNPVRLLHIADSPPGSTPGANDHAAMRLSSSQTGSVGEIALANNSGEFSNLAQPNDLVIRSEETFRSDIIISARNDKGSIRFGTTTNGTYDVERMIIHSNGNIGIGTVSLGIPQSKLHIGGAAYDGEALLTLDGGTYEDMRIHFPTSGLQLTNGADARPAIQLGSSQALNNFLVLSNVEGPSAAFPGVQDFIRISDVEGIEFFTNGDKKLTITPDGFVGIGTPAPHPSDAYTTPAYKLGVKGLIKCQEVHVTLDNWADHVFDPEYKLAPLSEVEAYISDNGHLPGIPSEKKVLAEGIGLGEMNTKLLQKIEELTLYIIELEKRMDSLKGK